MDMNDPNVQRWTIALTSLLALGLVGSIVAGLFCLVTHCPVAP